MSYLIKLLNTIPVLVVLSTRPQSATFRHLLSSVNKQHDDLSTNDPSTMYVDVCIFPPPNICTGSHLSVASLPQSAPSPTASTASPSPSAPATAAAPSAPSPPAAPAAAAAAAGAGAGADAELPRQRPSRVSLRKQTSVVHANLEENYDAVTASNHEALLQLLDQVGLILWEGMVMMMRVECRELRWPSYRECYGISRGAMA